MKIAEDTFHTILLGNYDQLEFFYLISFFQNQNRTMAMTFSKSNFFSGLFVLLYIELFIR